MLYKYIRISSTNNTYKPRAGIRKGERPLTIARAEKQEILVILRVTHRVISKKHFDINASLMRIVNGEMSQGDLM